MFLTLPSTPTGSSQVTHGTVRLAPVKSIDGDCAVCVESKFSDSGKPSVCHTPPLNARTTMFTAEDPLCAWANAAHGTRAPPVSEPAVRSLTLTFCVGSIVGGASLTCVP